MSGTVDPLVCLQDYTKFTKSNFIKLAEKLEFVQRKSSLKPGNMSVKPGSADVVLAEGVMAECFCSERSKNVNICHKVECSMLCRNLFFFFFSFSYKVGMEFFECESHRHNLIQIESEYCTIFPSVFKWKAFFRQGNVSFDPNLTTD